MRFIDLPPDDVDAAIREAQRRIVEALDLDRSTLFQLGDDGDLLYTHGWWRPERPGAARTRVGEETASRGCSRSSRPASWCASRARRSLPDGVDRASVIRFDIKSIVAIPLSVARRIVGARPSA